MIHFPCPSYMTTRFCYLFINHFIMLINFLLFLTHTLLKTDLCINRGILNLHLNTPHSTFDKRLLKYKGSVLWNNLPEKLKLTAKHNYI